MMLLADSWRCGCFPCYVADLHLGDVEARGTVVEH